MSTAPTESAPPTEPSKESTLLTVVHQSGLEPESQQRLISSFQPLFEQAEKWRQAVASINVTDVSQTAEMRMARATRLALKEIRVKADKQRKALKEDVVRRGKAIDGVYNTLEYLIAPLEDHLKAQEEFAERKEAERLAALKIQREDLLKPYGVDTSVYLLDKMSDETFSNLLASTKAAHEAKVEAARKVEADRLAAEAARIAEDARIRAENERLKAEAEERARQAAEKAEADRIAREKAEAEAKAEADRREVLRLKREGILKPYEVDTTFLKLGDMTQDQFDALLDGSRVAFEQLQAQRAAQAEERRLAQERLAKERADREAAEAAAKAAQEAADRKAADEKAAREKAEADLAAAQKAEKDRQEAENRVWRQEEAAKRALEAAPDVEKVKEFAKAVRALTVPTLSTPEGKAFAQKLTGQIDRFAKWVDGEAVKLTPPETPAF